MRIQVKWIFLAVLVFGIFCLEPDIVVAYYLGVVTYLILPGCRIAKGTYGKIGIVVGAFFWPLIVILSPYLGLDL